MKNTFIIIRRELGAYLSSPVAYVFLVIFLLLASFLTFMGSNFFKEGQVSAAGFFYWHTWLFLVFVPAIGMRLWAEERRQGTLELLFTLPISQTEAIIGKFFAGWIFMGLALLLTFPFPATLYYLGHPDTGCILTGYLASFLIAGVCLAVSSATSATTRNQVVSFVSSLAICLLLVLAGFPPITNLLLKWNAPNALVEWIASFSIVFHASAMQRGVLDIRDIFYFVAIIIFCLSVTGLVLRHRR